MDAEPSRYEALLLARSVYSSDQAMADALGVTQPTIWRWLNQSRQLPAEKVLLVEQLTGVSRHHLRPDIYPPDLGPSPRWHGVDRAIPHVAFNRRDGLQERAA